MSTTKPDNDFDAELLNVSCVQHDIGAAFDGPRLGLDHELGAVVVAQALRQPEKARGSSWAAELLRKHHGAHGRAAAPSAESLVRG